MATKSRQCTTDLLDYLRFLKGINLIATEVKYNRCLSDVLAVHPKSGKILEFEVKISKSDFKKDFEKVLGKSRYSKGVFKHASYADPNSRAFTPHNFFFVVPEEMVEFAEAYLEAYPEYGLLSWNPKGSRTAYSRAARGKVNTRIILIKKAKSLAGNRLDSSIAAVKHKILLRATSELVSLRLRESN